MFNARTGAVAVLLVLALAGCTPDSPDAGGTSAPPTDSATSSPTATAAPTPTMPAFAEDQVVVTVTATATAPNGATLDIAMKTYYPVAADSPEATQIQEYLAFVGNASEVADPGFTQGKGSVLQVSKLTAAAASGVWPSSAGILPSLGPGVTDTVIDIPAGPIVGTRLSVTGAGSGFGVAAIYSQDGSKTDVNAWAQRFTYYGFTDAFAGTTLSNCAIDVTALGSASPGVGGWLRHNCFIGVGD